MESNAYPIASILSVEDQWGNDIIDVTNITRNGFANCLSQFGYTKGIEVGTEAGVYAEVLCKANPSLELICVDPYQAYSDYLDFPSQSELDNLFETAKEKLAPYNARILREFSADAADRFPDESLDFVYLDANHTFKYVLEDLNAWTPKVRVGGIVSGHDYIRRKDYPSENQFGVIEALDIFRSENNISPLFLIGYSSWFFVVDSLF